METTKEEHKAYTSHRLFSICRSVEVTIRQDVYKRQVQDLPTELDIGNPSLVPVILQAPAADLQRPNQLHHISFLSDI